MRKTIAATSVSVACSVTAAYSGPVTQPGEQVGLATGFPLPEGVYAIDTFSVGRSYYRFAPDIGVNIPLIVWSSPCRISDHPSRQRAPPPSASIPFRLAQRKRSNRQRRRRCLAA